MSRYDHIKQSALEANLQLPKLGLVLFTFGNVSAVDRQLGVFAIKPSGVPYELLKRESMVIVDFDGKVVEGDLRPSSGYRRRTRCCSKHWEKIGGIVHTHSTYATAWAQAQRDIPILGTTHADHCTVDIPCAPPMNDQMIKGDYEHETGFQILNCLLERNISYEEIEMILVGKSRTIYLGKNAGESSVQQRRAGSSGADGLPDGTDPFRLTPAERCAYQKTF